MWYVAGLLVLAGAAFLRLNGLGARCLWIDEAYTYHLAALETEEIVRRCAAPGSLHPPLSFLLLHGWMSLLGSSPLSLRLPASLLGIVRVPLAWFLMRGLLGSVDRPQTSPAVAGSLLPGEPPPQPAAGVVADGGRRGAVLGSDGGCSEGTARTAAALYAVLMSCTPMEVFTSRQARGYSLALTLWMLALLAAVHVLRLENSPVRRGTWWAVLTLSALALCYTHNLGLLLVTSLGAWMWWRTAGDVRQALWEGVDQRAGVWDRLKGHSSLRVTLCFTVTVAALYVPWTATLVGQAEAVPRTYHHQLTWSRLSNDVATTLVSTFVSPVRMPQGVADGVALGVGGLLAWQGVCGGRGSRFLVFQGVVPFLGMLAYSMSSGMHILQPRYLTLAAVSCLGTVSLAVARIPHPVVRGVVITVLANIWVLGISVNWPVFSQRAAPGMGGVAATLRGGHRPGEPIVTLSPAVHLKLTYELRNDSGLAPRLLVADPDRPFAGRRYLRREELLPLSDSRAMLTPPLWVVREDNEQQLEFPWPAEWQLGSIAWFAQEFPWERSVSVTRIVRRDLPSVGRRQIPADIPQFRTPDLVTGQQSETGESPADVVRARGALP